jgi:hypothetical protein
MSNSGEKISSPFYIIPSIIGHLIQPDGGLRPDSPVQYSYTNASCRDSTHPTIPSRTIVYYCIASKITYDII